MFEKSNNASGKRCSIIVVLTEIYLSEALEVENCQQKVAQELVPNLNETADLMSHGICIKSAVNCLVGEQSTYLTFYFLGCADW